MHRKPAEWFRRIPVLRSSKFQHPLKVEYRWCETHLDPDTKCARVRRPWFQRWTCYILKFYSGRASQHLTVSWPWSIQIRRIERCASARRGGNNNNVLSINATDTSRPIGSRWFKWALAEQLLRRLIAILVVVFWPRGETWWTCGSAIRTSIIYRQNQTQL